MKRQMLILSSLCVHGVFVLGQENIPAFPGSEGDSVFIGREQEEVPNPDKFFDRASTESEYSGELDRLLWMEGHPYNLNKVTREELETIPGVTPLEAVQVIRMRALRRSFTSMRQIAAIGSHGEELVQKLSPFVFISPVRNAGWSSVHHRVQFSSRFSMDLQPRKGFRDNSFLGSTLKAHTTLSLAAAPHAELGLMYEKDPGEEYPAGFTSGFMVIRNSIGLSQLIVGDYTLEAGQGLVLWRASGLGKGVDPTVAVRKSGLDAQPYRSSDEFNFLRGAALTYSSESCAGLFTATGFVSRRLISASVDELGRITSFYSSGLFRTSTELGKRDVSKETLIGMRVRLAVSDNWTIGTTYYRTAFDREVVSSSPQGFKGKTAGVGGIDAEIHTGGVALFGEVARSGEAAVAGIVGAIVSVPPAPTVVVVYRNYSADFTGLHAGSFGERNDAKNEEGVYTGLELRLTPWLRMTGHYDQFRFPRPTSTHPFPAGGREILLHADASISRRCDLSVRFADTWTEVTGALTDNFGRQARRILDRREESSRVIAIYRANPRIRMKGCAEITRIRYSLIQRGEYGYVFYQDLRYSLPPGFSVEARLAFFDTKSYDSRLYVYENDLRGAFSNPALYGRGRRWYCVVQWLIGSAFRLSAKYSETKKEGVTSVGTGSSEILGDVDNKIAVQLDFAI
jgi:hypothetical protein